GYPEYFAEIAAQSNEDAAGAAAEQPQGLKPTPLAAFTARLKPCPDMNLSVDGSGGHETSGRETSPLYGEIENGIPKGSSGADPSPRRAGAHEAGEFVPAASVRDGSSFRPVVLSSAARNEMKTVETEFKYAGYLDQQRKAIERLKKAEQRVIPEWFDYGKVSGLSREMNEK